MNIGIWTWNRIGILIYGKSVDFPVNRQWKMGLMIHDFEVAINIFTNYKWVIPLIMTSTHITIDISKNIS